MKTNPSSGFTLIELVIVIVILGILAAAVTSKFQDIQGDARTAVIQQIDSSLKTSQDLIHAKSLISGNPDAISSTVTVNGSTIINTRYGYAQGTDLVDKLLTLAPASDFFVFKSSNTAIIGHLGATSFFTCFTASFGPNTVDTPPIYITNVTNCN